MLVELTMRPTLIIFLLMTVSDPCLFVKLSEGVRTFVWFHVDDTFVASTHPSELSILQAVLRRKFNITIKDQVDLYLGVNMSSLPEDIFTWV